MVHVTRVDLTERGIELPSDRVGMVVAQPHLCLTPNEPFTCLPDNKQRQLAGLQATLDVSLANSHGVSKTHFTILPEYSIPGLDGVAQIETSIANGEWPSETIIIGGVDALTKDQFADLAGRPRTYIDTVDNALARIGQNEWVNCSITWVKATDGTIEKWIQPKLVAAWAEANIVYSEMFRGDSIFAFKGSLTNGARYRFSTLLCFDWIGAVNDQRPWRWALEDLQSEAIAQGDGDVSLSWFFVIQCNDFPSHPTFLTQVPEFFRATLLARVRRERTCLVFANTAGKAVPGRCEKYGGTSLIFSRNTAFKEETSRPTVSKGGQRFRGNTILGGHRDAYFREMGACVHSFAQVNPDQAGGADARTFAVEHPYVFPLDGPLDDPRVPGDIVPACVKWVNDELDSAETLAASYATCALATDAAPAHDVTVAKLRKLDAKATCKIITLSKASIPAEAKPDDADLWEQAHVDALNHVVQTLTIMQTATEVTIATANRGHAALKIDGQTIDLVAVRGKSHRDCSEHIKDFTGGARRKVLLVSRDRDNNPLNKTDRSFLRPSSGILGQDQNITDPGSGKIHLDYHTLLQIFRNSPSTAAMLGEVNAKLAA
jgi:hypothetical protein